MISALKNGDVNAKGISIPLPKPRKCTSSGVSLRGELAH